MKTAKTDFVKKANEYGILFVRVRNSEEDKTGWGAIEFLLDNEYFRYRKLIVSNKNITINDTLEILLTT